MKNDLLTPVTLTFDLLTKKVYSDQDTSGSTCMPIWVITVPAVYEFELRTHRQTDRQTDKQTNRQTNRQTDGAKLYTPARLSSAWVIRGFHENTNCMTLGMKTVTQ